MAYTPQSAPQAIGPVTVAVSGTPVPLTQYMQTIIVGSGYMCISTDPVLINKLSLQASPYTHTGAGNTGTCYIGQSTMNKGTGAGVIGFIKSGGSFSLTTNVALNQWDLNKLFLDADNNGDGVIGSCDTI